MPENKSQQLEPGGEEYRATEEDIRGARALFSLGCNELRQENNRLKAEVVKKDEEIAENKARIDCLSMFVRRLYRRLRKHEPDAEVIQQANTYLKAIGQAGTPLRAEEQSNG